MQIIMPKLGLTMTHGTITEWLRAPGDIVKAEEALCTYETEKVTLELTAPEDGVLVEILAPAGTTVPAGAPVCEFLTNNEAQPVASFHRPLTFGPFNATPKARSLARALGVDLATVLGSGPEGRVQARDVEAAHANAQPVLVKATPLARRMAAAEGVDLRALTGTGPEGTITREDVEAAIRQVAAQKIEEVGEQRGRATEEKGAEYPPRVAAGERIIPLSSLRRTIAERMSASAFTAPHVTLFTEADASNLVSVRAQLNEELPKEAKISYNALLAALVARALKEHPQLNSRLDAGGLHLLSEINIALAVDTERGLMTPVLRHVDTLSLAAIQQGYNDLVARALAGKSLPGDFDAGTFTITNLGALEIDGFTPIINPPQAAILGVGRIIEKPVAKDGAVVIRPIMTLSLSFDHRIIDGAPAARFLRRIKQLVERPFTLLL